MLLIMTSLSTGQRVSHQGSESVCLALSKHTGFIVLALNEMKCIAHEENTARLQSEYKRTLAGFPLQTHTKME